MESIEAVAAEHIQRRFGREGRRFLASLDARIAERCKSWSLEPVRPLTGATSSSVLLVHDAGGTPLVLKTAITGSSRYPVDLRREHGWYENHPGVAPRACARHDAPGWSSLLIEHLDGTQPEYPQDLEAVCVALQALRPAPPPHPPFDATFDATFDVSFRTQLSLARMARAVPVELPRLRAAFAELLDPLTAAVQRSARLAHGDATPENMRRQRDGAVRLFDPNPGRAPFEADLARFLAYRSWGPDIAARLADGLARTGCDEAALLTWARYWSLCLYGSALASPGADPGGLEHSRMICDAVLALG